MPNTDFQNGIIVASIAGGGSNITPSGDIEITENGEYDVTAYETAMVNVLIPPKTFTASATTEKDFVANSNIRISAKAEEREE